MKKRLFAGICCLAIVTASAPLTVFAVPESAGGNDVGHGKLEGAISSNVFSVDVPTSTTTDCFDYILDPNGMIAKTNGARYPDKTFEDDATLYFANTLSTYSYSSISDSVEMINKCSLDLSVNVKISVDSAYTGKVVFSDDKDFSNDDKNLSMYMAILTDDDEIAISPDTGEAAIDDEDGVVLFGVESEAVSVEWDNSIGEYVTSVETIDPDLKSSYSFRLTGASNPYGAWVKDTLAPNINVVWKVTEQVGDVAPTLETNGVASISSGAIGDTDIIFDLGNGSLAATGIVSVKYGTTDLIAGKNAVIDSDNPGKVTIRGAFLSQLNTANKKTGIFTVTFDDPEGTTLEVPFSISD